MHNRRKIEKAAAALGVKFIRLIYATPVMLEMGDGDGGWLIITEKGSANGATADALIQEMTDRFGDNEISTEASVSSPA